MDQAPFDISVAPMMDWTDRHCRFFMRLLATHVRLYTEMVTTGAILFGDRDRHLRFDPAERKLALQLGGSDPASLGQCAKIGEDYGYDEINLNCGCPSDRVQNGSFGACLMKKPEHVADCIAAMSAAVHIPVTVKCRIGVDDCDDLPFLMNFIQTVRQAGCETFIIHARKAWLSGLSPKENREIPPLRYDIAAAIKQTFPDLRIILNGGIIETAQIHKFIPPSRRKLESVDITGHDFRTRPDDAGGLDIFDGVMIGREAYRNPYCLAEIEHAFYGRPLPDRAAIALAMIPYIERQQRDFGTPVKTVIRHMLGLFAGQYGGKGWRQVLSTESFQPGVRAEYLIKKALGKIGSMDNYHAA